MCKTDGSIDNVVIVRLALCLLMYQKQFLKMFHKKIGMNSFETKCLHGCNIFEWLLFLLECKVTFLKSSGHQTKFILSTKLD
jgi:hypothetical protein